MNNDDLLNPLTPSQQFAKLCDEHVDKKRKEIMVNRYCLIKYISNSIVSHVDKILESGAPPISQVILRGTLDVLNVPIIENCDITFMRVVDDYMYTRDALITEINGELIHKGFAITTICNCNTFDVLIAFKTVDVQSEITYNPIPVEDDSFFGIIGKFFTSRGR